MELHPYIVHYPIALISLLYIFQVFTVLIPNFTPKYLNLWVLIPATLSTIPAMISGQKTEKLLDNLCPEAIEALHYHKIFANITVWGMIVLTFFWVFIALKKKATKEVQKLMLAFLTILFISVTLAGYLGGQLVHVWKT